MGKSKTALLLLRICTFTTPKLMSPLLSALGPKLIPPLLTLATRARTPTSLPEPTSRVNPAKRWAKRGAQRAVEHNGLSLMYTDPSKLGQDQGVVAQPLQCTRCATKEEGTWVSGPRFRAGAQVQYDDWSERITAARLANETKDWTKVNPCLAKEHAPCNGCGVGGSTKWCCKRSDGSEECKESTYEHKSAREREKLWWASRLRVSAPFRALSFMSPPFLLTPASPTPPPTSVRARLLHPG